MTSGDGVCWIGGRHGGKDVHVVHELRLEDSPDCRCRDSDMCCHLCGSFYKPGGYLPYYSPG